MQTKIIVSLDQSTKCTGWAVFINHELIDYGHYSPKSKGDYLDRIVEIRKWLEKVLEKATDLKVEFVIEDILPNGNSNVTRKLANLQGVILEVCREYKIPVEIVKAVEWKSSCRIPKTVRKEEKLASQKFVTDKYNVVATEDESDAICIGYHYDIENNSLDWS